MPAVTAEEYGLSRLADGLLGSIAVMLGGRDNELFPEVFSYRASSEVDFTRPEIYEFHRRLREQRAVGSPASPASTRDAWNEAVAAGHAARERAHAEMDRLGEAVDLLNDDDLAVQALVRSTGFVSENMGASTTLSPFPVGQGERERLRAALNRLDELWPEMRAELGLTMRRLVVFQGDVAIGYADFAVHHAVFLKHTYISGDDVTATSLLEELVHEASHVRFNSMMSLDRCFTNPPDELYSTPLRRDRRPMFGLLHQVLILRRLKELYGRAEAADGRGTWAEQLDEIEASLSEGLQTVRQHAELTPAGAELVDAVSAPAWAS